MRERLAGYRYWLGVLIVSMAFGWLQSVTAAEIASTRPPSVGAAKAADIKNPEYWFRKGSLCATYGNNGAAVRFFQKAIALNPRHDRAYFSQGVSHGQLGDYGKALAAIDKAIALDSRNGLYYYGRGRVHLLAGDNELALKDFREAAELGDEDAQVYLSVRP